MSPEDRGIVYQTEETYFKTARRIHLNPPDHALGVILPGSSITVARMPAKVAEEERVAAEKAFRERALTGGNTLAPDPPSSHPFTTDATRPRTPS